MEAGRLGEHDQKGDECIDPLVGLVRLLGDMMLSRQARHAGLPAATKPGPG